MHDLGKAAGRTRVPGRHDPGTPVAADLAAVAAEIAQEFPLVLEQTSLVLLDLDPEHLHAFWILNQADLTQASAAFPAGEREPGLVVRLQRLHPDGRAEILATAPLPAETRGDARFALANDDASYQAELGLHSGEGGWMLLARSNQARLPRPVGVPIPPWAGGASGPDSPSPDEPAAADTETAPARAEATQPPGGTPLASAAPPPVAQEPPPAPGTRPARWVLQTALAGNAPPTSQVPLAREQDAEIAGESGPTGMEPPPDLAWAPAIRLDWPWLDQVGLPVNDADATAAGASVLPPDAPWASSKAEPHQAPQPTEAPARTEAQSGAAPLSSFALGRGPDTPVIEAELLVHVSAQPGTLVDLHGRPLRVGPSGRSTLRIPVTDLTGLAALLGSPRDGEGPEGKN